MFLILFFLPISLSHLITTDLVASFSGWNISSILENCQNLQFLAITTPTSKIFKFSDPYQHFYLEFLYYLESPPLNESACVTLKVNQESSKCIKLLDGCAL